MDIRVQTVGGLVAALLMLAGPSAVEGQGRTLGTVRGVVVDTNGAAVSGARVLLRNLDGGGERSAVSNRDGSFEFLLVPPGTWNALAERLGYRPLVVEGIPVGPIGESFVSMRLIPAPPPVERIDTVTWSGSGGATTAGGWVPRAALDRHVQPGGGILAALTLGQGDRHVVAGLPTRLAGLEIGGHDVPIVAHPGLGSDPAADLAWPHAALAATAWEDGVINRERVGHPVGVLSGFVRPGSRDWTVRAAGDFEPSGVASSRFFTPGAADRGSWRGAVSIGGPIIRDTVQFAISADVSDRVRVHPAPWTGAVGPDTVLGAARDAWGVDLAGWAQPWRARERLARGVGRFDWLIADRHLVSATGAWGRLEADNPDYGPDRLGWLGTRLEGTDWHAGISVISRLGGAANELRLGVSRTDRTATAPAGGRTVLVEEALAVGTSAGLAGRHARRRFSLTESIHVPTGSHRLTFGGGLQIDAADDTWAWGAEGEFYFGDATRLASGTGALTRVASTIPAVRHTHVGVGLWLQDAWRAAPGLEFTFGTRVDVRQRPGEAVATNAGWRDRTGLDNAAYAGTVLRISPAGAMHWTPSERSGWDVEISGGLRSSLDELAAFTELITHDGRVTVRRQVGTFGTWPGPTGSGSALPRLALLGPDFLPPRAGHATLSVTGDLGAVVLRLGGLYRHTDFLTRRTNLNRLAAPSAEDQDGRPLYGTLVQQGGLLAADPSSARRFAGYDLVSALNADGAQDRWEAGVALERRFGSRIGFLVSYTWSDTRDNWLGAAAGPDDQLDPFPDGLGGREWAESTSDFDVPHRLVAAFDWRPFGGLRLGGLFRVESGRPFTPGFRPGVDANADGSARNDPAFVDGGVPGMDALVAEWSCLSGQVGAFAARNSCRGPTVRALDVWVRLELSGLMGVPLALTIEGLNVLEPDIATRDAALVLVDPTAALVTDAAAGVVTVPLMANPNFGEPLLRRGSARALRVGIRIND